MDHLKHSLHDISKAIANAIVRGDVECYEYIHDTIFAEKCIKSTIYEKEDIGVYIGEDYDWFGNGDDEYYDSYTFLYAKGISEEDLRTIEKTVQQILDEIKKRGE